MSSDTELPRLADMKYSDLRRLAKKHGIKANMKADKMMEALAEYLGAHPGELLLDAAASSCDEQGTGQSAEDTEAEPETGNTTASSRPAKGGGKRKAKTQLTKDTDKGVPPDSTEDTDGEAHGKKANRKKVRTRKGKAMNKPVELVKETVTPRARLSSKPATPRVASSTQTPKRQGTPVVKTPKPTVSVHKPDRRQTPASAGGMRKSSVRASLCVPASATVVPVGTRKRSKSDAHTQEPMGTPGSERRSRRTHTPSPGVRGILTAMKEDMTAADQKKSLLAALDKRVQEKQALEPDKPGTHIPRFTALTGQKDKDAGKEGKKTPAKDWSKIHQRQFNKMESITSYLERKRKRTASTNTSVSKIRKMTEGMRAAVESLKKHRTPTSISKQSRTIGAKTQAVCKSSLFKSPHPGAVFVPKVTSTTKMNLTFSSAAPQANSTFAFGRKSAGKGRAANAPRRTSKTPSRGRSPRAGSAKTPRAQSVGWANLPKVQIASRSISKENTGKKLLNTTYEKSRLEPVSERKMCALTPFSFQGINDSLDTSSSKNMFDLKKSLSRPVTWKAHKGPIKPLQAGNMFLHEHNVKEVNVKSKDDRRKEALRRKADSRLDAQMKRRGINI